MAADMPRLLMPVAVRPMAAAALRMVAVATAAATSITKR
jgi:hypothetical protein